MTSDNDERGAEPPSSWGRLGRAIRVGGLNDPDHWVWCGSVIRSDDGRYHMFASRWSKDYGFHHWSTTSEIVRAVADRPEGPYHYEDTVLAPRGAEFWDGRMAHNPTIHRHGDTYLLYYTGVTYPFEVPRSTARVTIAQDAQVLRAKQIGLATAPSPEGPWTRADQPILAPRAGHWDHYFVSNAAPVVHADGSVLLVYKGFNSPLPVEEAAHRLGEWWQHTEPAKNLHLGIARADHWSGPYERAADLPILQAETFDLDRGVEDPYVWHAGDHYELVCKDMTGEISGTLHGGVHAWSRDGVEWHLYERPQAYSRRLVWDDGTVSQQGQLERCELLIEDGRPTYMFAATGDGPGGFDAMTHTFNVCVPFEHSDASDS